MFYELVPILLSVSSLCIASQKPLKIEEKLPFTTDFDAFTSNLLDRWHVPGLAIAIIDKNDTYSKGYGIERFPDKAVTPDTLFYTGSTTKSFTAAAISLLIDDTSNTSKPLTWQTPLVSVLRDDFVLEDEWTTSHVTLEDALSHRTGMPRHDAIWTNAIKSVSEVVRLFRHLPATAEIRTKWQYNNMMYITASYFLEKVTGTWLGDFLKDRIYDPLNMTGTFFSLADARAAVSAGSVSLAQGYTWLNHTQEYLPLAYMDSPVTSGAGATISTVLDYAKWLRCLVTMSAPLSSAGHQAIRLPRMSPGLLVNEDAGFRGADGYALGLGTGNYRGELVIWHNGGVPGFGTNMAFLPRLQWGVVMMANTVEGGSIAQQVLLYKLIDDLLDVPAEERYDWEAEYEAQIRQGVYNLEHAREMAYPDVPEPPIPLTLPLADYAGVYTHPAYPPFNLSVTNYPGHKSNNDGDKGEHLYTLSFVGLSDDAAYKSFHHVSGEYFLMYMRAFTNKDWNPEEDSRVEQDHVVKAEFKIGEDGKVKELGVNVDPEMLLKKIWWRREN